MRFGFATASMRQSVWQARRPGRVAAKTALTAVLLTVVECCAARQPPATAPRAPTAVAFVATAYCLGTTTASGVRVRRGLVAADPVVLPLGSVIRVQQSGLYDGVYTVMDTGPKVKGHHVDLFIESCAAAKRFGRRTVRVSIVNAVHD
jgi:3D (Asp-Asp-Asp) domain-containing protein